MGTVFLARDDRLGRDVAIKVIRQAAMGGLVIDLSRERFENEARAVAALSHPNVVQVFDMGFEGETPYLVMEVVAGASLKDRIDAGDLLDPAEVRMLGIQMARALAAAHKRSILHRDVKPANILTAEPALWKLADFGVAHIPESDVTLSGQFVGSPAFAAPESIQRGEFSPASDIYGLGATLYMALCGEPPHGPRGLWGAGALASSKPAPLVTERRPDVPPAVAEVIARTLDREPEKRPLASELAEAMASASDLLTGAPPISAEVPATVPGGPSALAAMAAQVPTAPGMAAMAAQGQATMPGYTSVSAAPITAPMAALPAMAALPDATGYHSAQLDQARLRKIGLLGLAAVIAIAVLVSVCRTTEQGSGATRPEPYQPPAPSVQPSPVTPGYDEPTERPDHVVIQEPDWAALDGKQRREWMKVFDQLRKGNVQDAMKRLEGLARRYPDDQHARNTLEQLRQAGVSDETWNGDYWEE